MIARLGFDLDSSLILSWIPRVDPLDAKAEAADTENERALAFFRGSSPPEHYRARDAPRLEVDDDKVAREKTITLTRI
jgi:hypothetical protein